MPCGDGGVPYTTYREEEFTKSFLESALCATLKILGTKKANWAIENADYKEAGITKSKFEKWWNQHQAKDAARIKYEKARQEQEQLRKTALAKLTEAERKLLKL